MLNRTSPVRTTLPQSVLAVFVVACMGRSADGTSSDEATPGVSNPDLGNSLDPGEVDPGAGEAGADPGEAEPESSESERPIEVDASIVGTGFDACTGSADARELSLVREPEYFTVFHFVGPTECESLDVAALLRNTGTEPVHILGLGVGNPDFLILDMTLPRDVQPGASLSVPMRFIGNEESTTTPLTVATESGCRTFEVRGNAASEGLFDVSPRALDFGDVIVGGVSEIQTVTFQSQFADPAEAARDGFDEFGFGAGPDNVFEVVSEHPSPTPLIPCEPVHVQIRFRAPLVPGPITGLLGYGVGPGDGGLYLYGRAVPQP